MYSSFVNIYALVSWDCFQTHDLLRWWIYAMKVNSNVFIIHFCTHLRLSILLLCFYFCCVWGISKVVHIFLGYIPYKSIYLKRGVTSLHTHSPFMHMQVCAPLLVTVVHLLFLYYDYVSFAPTVNHLITMCIDMHPIIDRKSVV